MIEAITVIAIIVFLAALTFIPDSWTATRRHLERDARDWKRTTAPVLSDQSLIAKDISLIGAWGTRHRLERTKFVFASRADGRYDVEFFTGGSLGACELSRIGTMTDGVLVLNGAVAGYIPRTYDTLYAIRIDDMEYLLPAATVPLFERKRNAGSDSWKRWVHSRIDE